MLFIALWQKSILCINWCTTYIYVFKNFFKNFVKE